MKNLWFWSGVLIVTSLGYWFFYGSTSEVVPQTDEINIEWSFIPFHLEQSPRTDLSQHLSSLFNKYPSFSKLFFTSILPIYNEKKEMQKELLLDDGLVKLLDTCNVIFDDLGQMRSDFDQAFKYYVYYTEDYNIPNVYTFVSGFAYQTIIFRDGPKDGIGIGLDMFIGSEFPYKKIDPGNPGFSSYLTHYFDQKNLVRKALLAWLDDKIPSTSTSELLDIIIRNGKILYILEKILPLSSKELILEYSPKEYEWCLQNESTLWSHLLKENLLYENDFSKIHKLVNPSPSAPGIPKEAPGGVANYIGWRIIQDYMNRSKDSLNSLMQNNDPQQILNASKYKPRLRK